MKTISESVANAWFTTWLQPAKTWPTILNTPYSPSILLLGSIPGVSVLLLLLSFSDVFTLPLIIALSALLGSLLGLINLHLFGAALKWFRQWVGDKGGHAEYRTVFAWSSLPTAAGIVLLPVFVFLRASGPPGGRAAVFYAVLLSLLGLLIWSFVLLLKGLKAINGYSTARAAVHAVMAVAATLLISGASASLLLLVVRLGSVQTIHQFFSVGVLAVGK